MGRRYGVFLFVFAVALLVPSLQADTLTLRSNVEINGRVEYEEDAFTITARYHNGDRKRTYDRKEVLTLEISSRDFNPGEPPKEIGVTEARSGATRDASRAVAASGQSGSNGATEKQSQRASARRSVLGSDDFDRATTDVVWLRDQTNAKGRLVSLKNGHLTIKGREGIREIDLQNVATVLVAPE